MTRVLSRAFAVSVLGLIVAVGCPEPHGGAPPAPLAGGTVKDPVEQVASNPDSTAKPPTVTEPADTPTQDELDAIEDLKTQGSAVKVDAAGHATEVQLVPGGSDVLCELAARLPNLQRLVATKPDMKDSSLEKLQGLKKLRVLDLDQADVGNTGMAHLVDLPLVDVNLKLTNVTDDGVKSLAEIKTLRSCKLIKTKVTDAGVAHLAGHPAIEFLDLQDVNTCSNKSLETAATMPKLKRLRVYGPQYDDAGMDAVAKIANLESFSAEQTRIGDAGIAKLAGAAKLRELLLFGTQVSDEGMAKLGPMPTLKNLELRGTACCGGEIPWLANVPNLEEAGFEESFLDDTGLPAILALKNLKTLMLVRTSLTSAGVGKLAELSSLEKLNVDQIPVVDEDVRKLTALKNLTFIHVGSTKITDAGLEELVRGLPKLQTIDCSVNPGVSAPTVEKLRGEFPNVKFKF